MKHELKIWPQYFSRVIDGSKTFEVRKNDRGFQPGDEVVLREYDPTVIEHKQDMPIVPFDRYKKDREQWKYHRPPASHTLEALKFYADVNHWKDLWKLPGNEDENFKYFYCLRQRTDDFEILVKPYHCYAGKRARQTLKEIGERSKNYLLIFFLLNFCFIRRADYTSAEVDTARHFEQC